MNSGILSPWNLVFIHFFGTSTSRGGRRIHIPSKLGDGGAHAPEGSGDGDMQLKFLCCARQAKRASTPRRKLTRTSARTRTAPTLGHNQK